MSEQVSPFAHLPSRRQWRCRRNEVVTHARCVPIPPLPFNRNHGTQLERMQRHVAQLQGELVMGHRSLTAAAAVPSTFDLRDFAGASAPHGPTEGKKQVPALKLPFVFSP